MYIIFQDADFILKLLKAKDFCYTNKNQNLKINLNILLEIIRILLKIIKFNKAGYANI